MLMNICLSKHNINDNFPLLKIFQLYPYTRHRLWMEIVSNEFISTNEKRIFMDIYTNANRTYSGFSRLVRIWRIRKAKQTITTDLYMNEIDKTHKNSMMIYQNNTNYWFTISDLKNQIETAILNSPYYFSDPLRPKNPYTNIPFNNSTLYNIYFKMLSSTYLPSMIVNSYFLCGFDLYKFRLENEYIIRETHFRNYVNNADSETIFDEIMNMTSQYKLRISSTIPRQEFIKIMRPYFYLHLVSSYHIWGIEKQPRARHLLASRMLKLHRYNKNFGRKYINTITNSITKSRTIITTYNLDHPPFTMENAY